MAKDDFEDLESILQFNSYEEYLDSQITPLDMFYLDDEEVARSLVELGYRGSGETLSRDEFEEKKRQYEFSKRSAALNVSKPLASSGKDFAGLPFLRAIAEREDLVRNGKLTVPPLPHLFRAHPVVHYLSAG
jgi:hypothetical protein